MRERNRRPSIWDFAFEKAVFENAFDVFDDTIRAVLSKPPVRNKLDKLALDLLKEIVKELEKKIKSGTKS